jgi:putative intracellular protease/amidase
MLRWSALQLDVTLTDEVGVMVDMLEKARYKPVVATETGGEIVGRTSKQIPDLKLSAVHAAEYAGFLIPCGQMSTGHVEPEAIEIVKEAAAQKKPIAAQHHGIDVLNAAGVLKAGSWPDAYQGAGVVQNAKIITSWNCPVLADLSDLPDATAELTRTFIEVLKAAG